MFLSEQAHQEISDEVKTRVKFVIDHMDHSTEIKTPADTFKQLLAEEKALAVIQDADRLDSIGAVGIAHVYSLGGSMDKPIYGERSLKAACQPEFPGSCQEVAGSRASECSTMLFFDKLFHIEGRMKTSKGRELAKARHHSMTRFVRSIRYQINSKFTFWSFNSGINLSLRYMKSLSKKLEMMND